MLRTRLLGVLALYAATVLAVLVLLASVLLPAMVVVHPFSILVPSGYVLIYALDTDYPRALFAVPFAICLFAVGAYVGAGELAPLVQSVDAVGNVGVGTVQAGATVLALAVFVAGSLPAVVDWYAWRELDAAARTDAGDSTRFPDRFAAHAPDRLSTVVLDDPDPAVYVVDDGRRAILGFTAGATRLLDGREREAVVARELTRVVDREAAASFWASALAFGAARLVDPISTPEYEARAGGKVRLPYWFVAPLKIVGAVLGLVLCFALPIALLATAIHVNAVLLVLAYAVATVAAGFGLTKAARWLANDLATDAVLTADEHGAVLGGDPEPLAAALRKLHAADVSARTDDSTENGRLLDDGDDSIVASGESTAHDRQDDTLDAFGGLVHFPTDRVPVVDRLDALEDVADRLDDRRSTRPTTGNASS
jgi:Zn-dependent protease with chaperone function